MMAEPIAPGRGPPVYQPATAVVDGTCSVPLGLRPSVISLVSTPMTGMVSETGAATGRGLADWGGATIGPVGAGSASVPTGGGVTAAVACRVSSSPVAPPPMTTRPAASAIAAADLRVGTLRFRAAACGGAGARPPAPAATRLR